MLSRIPDIHAGLGIDAGVLGICLPGQPVGAIVAFLLSSRLIEAVGTLPVLLAIYLAQRLSPRAVAAR